MDAPLRLLLPPSSSSEYHHRRRMLWMLTTTPGVSSLSSYSTYCVCLARKRPWDSNAESFRRRKFDFSFEDDEEEEIDDDDDWIDQGSGFLQKAIDNIFIFKVLKSYGWMLPFIIISLLLVSGPKAFIYTLGLAIALSLIAYAFQNLTQRNPARKFKPKKRSSTATSRTNDYVKHDKASRKRTKESTVRGSVQGKQTFGGWDELDEAVDYTAAEPIIKTPEKVDLKESAESTATEAVKMPNPARVRSELNRLNRRRREMSRTPLMLRLLVAAFPFLSSWIKLL